MDNVKACNLALSRIGFGAQRPIVALTDDTEYAQCCDRVFQDTVRAVLSEHSWPWANKSVALALTSFDAPSGWTYAYAMPNDAISIVHVEADGFVPDWISNNDSRNRWEIYANSSTDGQIICTDLAEAWVFYQKEITELQFTSELFGQAVAWRLASELALGLKADAKLAQWAMQMYVPALDMAVAQAANQRGGKLRGTPESVALRGVSGYDRTPWAANSWTPL